MLNPTSFTLDTPELSINIVIRVTLTVALTTTEVYSQLCVLEFPPELLRDALPVAFQAVTRGVVADVLDIAGEQGERVGIETRVDDLWEIDDARFASPVENVIGRKVGVYIVVGQPEFDVTHQLIEDLACLTPG